VFESETVLCTVMSVNKELGMAGHEKDWTSALGDLTAGNGGTRGGTPAGGRLSPVLLFWAATSSV